MARSTRSAALETRTARLRLAKGKYHYKEISKGLALAYRRGPKASTWYVRALVDGAYRLEALGAADDHQDADGVAVLDYFQAQDEARKKAAQTVAIVKAGGEPGYTVADAMTDYIATYAVRGKAEGKARVEWTSKAHITPTLGTVALEELTTAQLRKWLDGLATTGPRRRVKKDKPVKHADLDDSTDARRRRKASANRVWNVLRAALNRAFQHGHCTTDAAWRRVKGFRAVDEPRVRYLSEDECIRLINATDAEFRPLVRAALLTGCRWGELVSARVADYEPDSKTLRVAESKAGKVRHVPLTDEGADLLDECAAGRPGSEPLFVRKDGTAWRRDYQARPMRAASKKAEIDPPVSFHLLRHAYGSLLVRAGAPLQVVSEALGHADTRMTTRHYSHLAPGFVADTVRAHLPRFSDDKPKVKTLRRKARKQEAPGTAATAPGAVVHAQWGPRHEQAES